MATKEGEGRARATSLDPGEARAKLAEAVGEPLGAARRPPPKRDYPAELRVAVSGEEIARTTVADSAELLGAVARIFRESASSGACWRRRRSASRRSAGSPPELAR